jgi:hypothetical protein
MEWIEKLPWWVKYAFAGGCGLMSACAGIFSAKLQDIGFGVGAALVAFAIIGTAWHFWRRKGSARPAPIPTLHFMERISGRLRYASDVASGIRSAETYVQKLPFEKISLTSLNGVERDGLTLAQRDALARFIDTVEEFNNFAGVAHTFTPQHTAHLARHRLANVARAFNSLVQEVAPEPAKQLIQNIPETDQPPVPKFIPVREAAARLYGEVRGMDFAKFWEESGKTEDGILDMAASTLAHYAPIEIRRPPSPNWEPFDLKHLSQMNFRNGAQEIGYVGEKPCQFSDPRILENEAVKAIAELKNLAKPRQ